ncbi:MAG: hypothetical protein EOR63_32150 [Mesorhizobium sp.]|nr:MAG: hypothetical protein EOR63_32150 [Mesorhizobium sp.]
MSESSNRSSIERLRELPEVFTLSAVASLGAMPKKTATVYLARWTAAGLVEASGPRSGVYFNLIKRPEVTGEMRLKALLSTYPSAVLIGESVLHNAGWTTQIPRKVSVAVIARRSYAQLNGFEVSGRPLSWFQKVHGALLKPEEAEFPTYGLRSLPPALALADLYGTKGAWHPDPDDLDMDDEQMEEAIEGGRTLGFELGEVLVRDDGAGPRR